MILSFNANPGQSILIPVQILDDQGVLSDGYQGSAQAQIDFVLMPNGTLASGYPLALTKFNTGIYKTNLVLPSGSAGLGSYLISTSWSQPETGALQNQLFTINCQIPFGNSSVIGL